MKPIIVISLFCLLIACHLNASVWQNDLFGKTAAEIDKSLILQDVQRENDMLVFSAKRGASVTVPDSENFNVDTNGITVNLILRLRKPEDAKNSGGNMMLFFKDNAYFLGITRRTFNFSIGAGGRKWSLAMIDGEAPPFGVWTHIAAVLKYSDDRAQGNDGTLLSLYVNGELLKSTFFRGERIDASDAPLMLGSGLGGYEMCGDIAEASAVPRVMNDEEIRAIARQSTLVKLPPSGWYTMPPEVISRLNVLRPQISTPHGLWVWEALRRAAFTGESQDKLCAVLDCGCEKLGLNLDVEEMVQAFNAAQGNYRLYATPEAILMLAASSGMLTSPVLGLFNRLDQTDVFSIRQLEWKLRFRDANGANKDVRSYDQDVRYVVRVANKTADGYEFQIDWTHDLFTATSRLKLTGGRLTADFQVKNQAADRLLTDVDFPMFRLSKLPGEDDKLVYPYMSGKLVKNPTQGCNFGFEFPRAEFGMQFFAMYDELGNGVYCALEDPNAHYKRLSLSGMNKEILVSWAHPVAYEVGQQGHNDYQLSGEAVLEIFHGNWYHAGRVYRRFLESKAKWWIKELPRTSTPAWFRNNAYSMIATASPVSIKELIYLTDYSGVPPVVEWAIWHKYDISDEGLKIFPYQSYHDQMLKDAHAHGIRLLPYMNPHIWGFAPGHKLEIDWFDNPAALRSAVKHADGSPEYEIYGKKHLVICPAEKHGQKDVYDQNIDIINYGFDGSYLDQLACHEPALCFDASHGHKLNDPALWLNQGQWPLWLKFRADIRQEHPDFVLTSEDTTDPYLNIMDGCMVWRWVNEDRIPLYQSIYAGRTQFFSRCPDAFNARGEGDFNSFFVKMAEQLVCGEQVGGFHLNDMYYASPQRIFAKKMIQLRKLLAPFLNASEMLEPVEFSVAPPEVTSNWAWSGKVQRVTLPQLLSCAWRHETTGVKMLIFANPINTAVNATVVLDKDDYDTLYLCREGHPLQTLPLTGKSLQQVCSLAPRSAEIWLLAKAGDGGAELATDAANLLQKFSTYTDPGKILPRGQNFQKRNQLSALDGRWIAPAESSWMKNCFMPVEPTFGWADGRFIQGAPDGEVFWGEVDFGEPNGPQTLELMVAADAPNAGGTLEFYEAKDGQTVGAPFAVVKVTETGDWFDFQTFQVPLLHKVSGKMDVITRFVGKGCVIRKWRVTE